MKRSIRIFIVCFVIAVLTIAILYTSYLATHVTPVPNGTVGNTAGNAYNGGLFCEYNNTIYFSNPYDNGGIYSMSYDESKYSKLTSVKASNINAGGNYLFYFQDIANGESGLGYIRTLQGIYRSNLHGDQITCLKRCLVYNLQLVNNNLYFLSSDDQETTFWELSMDKKDEKVIANSGINFACAQSDGSVYYNGDETNHYLYRYDTNSHSSSTIWEGDIWYPVYDNGYIYYLDVSSNYRLSRYSISDDRVEVLTHDRVDCFNIANGYLYYQKNSRTEPALKRMTCDGKDATILAEGNYTHINVAGNYVYFNAYESSFPIYRVAVGGSGTVSTFDGAMEAAVRYSN